MLGEWHKTNSGKAFILHVSSRRLSETHRSHRLRHRRKDRERSDRRHRLLSSVNGARVVAFLLNEQVLDVGDNLHVAVREPAVGNEDNAIGNCLARGQFQIGIER